MFIKYLYNMFPFHSLPFGKQVELYNIERSGMSEVSVQVGIDGTPSNIMAFLSALKTHHNVRFVD